MVPPVPATNETPPGQRLALLYCIACSKDHIPDAALVVGATGDFVMKPPRNLLILLSLYEFGNASAGTVKLLVYLATPFVILNSSILPPERYAAREAPYVLRYAVLYPLAGE